MNAGLITGAAVSTPPLLLKWQSKTLGCYAND